MSTYVDEKLAPQRPSTGGRAQARRDQLLARYGSREVGADRIVIDGMGHEEWRRIGAGGRRPVADDVFEQEVRS